MYIKTCNFQYATRAGESIARLNWQVGKWGGGRPEMKLTARITCEDPASTCICQVLVGTSTLISSKSSTFMLYTYHIYICEVACQWCMKKSPVYMKASTLYVYPFQQTFIPPHSCSIMYCSVHEISPMLPVSWNNPNIYWWLT